MPGVPPDTVAQVKKGIKGLFSRRSRSKQPPPQQDESSASKPAPATETMATDAAVPATTAATTKQGTVTTGLWETSPPALLRPETLSIPQPPTPLKLTPAPSPRIDNTPNTHHIAEPPSVAEAQSISLQPAGEPTSQPPAPSTPYIDAPKTETPVPATAAAVAAAPVETATATTQGTEKTMPAGDAHGMSATSGPLGDHLAGEEFGLGGHDEEEDVEDKKAGLKEDATEVLGRKGGGGEGVMNASEKAKMEEAQPVTGGVPQGVREGVEPKEGEEEGREF